MLVITRMATDSRQRKRRLAFTLPDGRIGYVEVLEAFHGKAKLGITFPLDVLISREELMTDGGDGDASDTNKA
jgi:hypothetical protein